MDLSQIAKQIKDASENIFLIYAFNSTGKTRLSVEYKETARNTDGRQTGVYYNAFSEDLFVWDNEHTKLNIVHSSLNQYHSQLSELDVMEKLKPYNPKYDFLFKTHDNPEQGFVSISFFMKDDDSRRPVKISRGEERIFIWCFFLALFEVEEWTDIQNQYLFIDDPVSSLDDNNIFITAFLLLELLKKNRDTHKIIITTHHMGIFSILQDWLRKGENSKSFKWTKWKETENISENGQKIIVREKQEVNKYLVRFLEFKNGEYNLVGDKRGIHLYHLLLLKILQDAKNKDELSTYHFALLRQVLECISSFLGSARFSSVLDIIYPEETDEVISFKTDVINAISHYKIYTQKIALLNDDNKKLLSHTLQRLIDHFHFSI